jgi:protein-L-isoaspartate O-methyltransferase
MIPSSSHRNAAEESVINFVQEVLSKVAFVDEVLEYAVTKALLAVDRRLFYGSDEKVFRDVALALPDGRYGLQPSLFLNMVAACGLKARGTCLVLGGELGYYPALLHELGQYVYAVDESNSLTQGARKRLDALDMMSVLLRSGRVSNGWTEHALYDSILDLRLPEERTQEISQGSGDPIEDPASTKLLAQLDDDGVFVGLSGDATLSSGFKADESKGAVDDKYLVTVARKLENGMFERYQIL